MVSGRLATRQVAEVLSFLITKQQRNDEPNVLQLMLLPDLSFLYPFQQLNLEALHLQTANAVDQAWLKKKNTAQRANRDDDEMHSVDPSIIRHAPTHNE